MIRTHKWSGLWGIPGGKIKWGETAGAALRREIKEETNLAVKDIRFALVQDCIHSREFYRDAHFVLLNYTCRCPAKNPRVKLNEEGREFRWVTPAGARQLPLNTPTRILLEAVLKRGAHPPSPRRSIRRSLGRVRRLPSRQPQMGSPTTRRRRQHARARALPPIENRQS
jgi:ADP-ribose pyrophosphatase YjhB (NUDIX family)